jgi:phage N-6-adenine-methyltransferase
LTLELSKDEEITLTGCEQIIERGLKTFVEVGEALITIRDGRLYRASHGTFEAYCSQRWGMTRRYANLLIDSSETIAVLGTMVPNLPDSERQVRPLTPLKDTPALAVAAWEDAQALAQEEGLPAPVARHVEAAAAPYREAVKVAEAEKSAANKPLSIFEGGGGSRHFSYDSAPTPTTPTEIIESVRTQKVAHVSHNSGENEWYTPSEYIEAARQVLGVIELDPASSEIANRTVKAERFITKEQDALSQSWQARTVWMNPPYSSDLIREFTKKFAAHALAGDFSEGIVLVNNATETRWFAEMVPACTAIVFPTGRIRYLDATGTPANSPLQGQAFLYAGDNPDAFIKIFSQFGWGAVLTGGAS